MNRTPLTRAIPPTTTQAAEGPGVVWHEGRPWCAQCSTSLGAAVIVAGHVASDVRPDRVPVCPMGRTPISSHNHKNQQEHA